MDWACVSVFVYVHWADGVFFAYAPVPVSSRNVSSVCARERLQRQRWRDVRFYELALNLKSLHATRFCCDCRFGRLRNTTHPLSTFFEYRRSTIRTSTDMSKGCCCWVAYVFVASCALSVCVHILFLKVCVLALRVNTVEIKIKVE